MMTAPIPEKIPVGDPVDGVLIPIAGVHLLAREAPADAEIVYAGRMIVRYGVRYLGKPHLSVVPGLVALDYGQMLNGEAAWEFITRRSNLHPRAEVFGWRSDGREEMVLIKNLDLALPVEALVYAREDDAAPMARVSALIAPADADLPPRLLSALPRFDTLSAWQERAL